MVKKLLVVAVFVGAAFTMGGANADICVNLVTPTGNSFSCPIPTDGAVNLTANVVVKTAYLGVGLEPDDDPNDDTDWYGAAVRYGFPVSTTPPVTGTGGMGIAIWVDGQMICITVPNAGSPGGLITTNGTCPGFPR